MRGSTLYRKFKGEPIVQNIIIVYIFISFFKRTIAHSHKIDVEK